MAEQYIVIRGQIENGNEVLAKRGQIYDPKNDQEKNRLKKLGVIELAPGSPPEPEASSKQAPKQASGSE